MKARVKETGEIVEVIFNSPYYDTTDGNERYYHYELDFQDTLDYWEKLKHQYAGIAMQGILSNKEMFNSITENIWPPDRPAYIAERCDDYATALVNRLKKEEK